MLTVWQAFGLNVQGSTKSDWPCTLMTMTKLPVFVPNTAQLFALCVRSIMAAIFRHSHLQSKLVFFTSRVTSLRGTR